MSLADAPTTGINVPANVMFVISTEYPIAEHSSYLNNAETFEYADSNGAPLAKQCPGRKRYTLDRIGLPVMENLCYFREVTYEGYFDSYKCYDYDKTILSSTIDQTKGAFTPIGPTNAFHECKGKWSGNYLNWATTPVVDNFRRLTTGGHRSVDTPTTTILEKAILIGKNSRFLSVHRIGGSSYTNDGVTIAPVDPSTVTPFPSNGNSPLYLRLRGTLNRLNDGYQMQVSDRLDFAKSESFYVRVKVCDKKVGLERNCKRFGAAYKPVGLIQETSHALRFGVASFVSDSDLLRPGGVLRARLKQIGPEKYGPGDAHTPNPDTEWSAMNGVLLTNPHRDDAARSETPKSGVVNFINQFGKVDGYKTPDPVGELYYEALKYFRRLPPTPEYLAGIKAHHKDGFPVIANWDDPIQFSCQKNFLITLADWSTWCDTLIPGNSFVDACIGHRGSPQGNDSAIDVTALTNSIGLLEGIPDMAAKSPKAHQWNTYYIAGLAYWANTRDIRPDDVQSPQTTGPQRAQSFFLEIGDPPRSHRRSQYWYAAKYGGFDDINNDGKPANERTFDLNGDGFPDNHFGFVQPPHLAEGLNKIFSSILAKASSVTAVAPLISNSDFPSGASKTNIYRTMFTPHDWTGDVVGGNLVIKDAHPFAAVFEPSWSARETLDKLVAGAGWKDNRKVVTMSAGRAVPFFRNNLTSTQQRALGSTAAAQTEMVAYLRGSRLKEGKTFRVRRHILGDIVHSRAVAVADKNEPYGESANPGYAEFKSKPRKKMIYVGANDGMLHAFHGEIDTTKDRNGGQEAWAYIPSFVITGPDGSPAINGLAAYGSRADPYVHHYYVDGELEVRDVDFARTAGSADTAPNWRTLLVGGLRKGGKGFYALDVTDGAAAQSELAVAEKALWEFTDADMGFSYGRPVIVKTKKDGWVVLLTSGYNNVSGAHQGQGFVYVVNAKTGKLIQKIGTGVGTAVAPSGLAQGMAYIRDLKDHTVDQFYVGDLGGNVWRFDLSTKTGNYPQPVKIAALTDPSGKPQPITIAPQIAIASNQRDRWVLVGTGKDLSPDDARDGQQQTMYAIRDGDKEKPASGTKTLTRRDLKAVADLGVRANAPEKGWLYDLPGDAATNGRQRITVDLDVANGVVSFIGKSQSGDPCAPHGAGKVYALEMETGFTVLRDKQGNPKPAHSGPAFAGSKLISINRTPAIFITDMEGRHTVLPQTLPTATRRK